MSTALSWTNHVAGNSAATYSAFGSGTPTADPAYPLSNLADPDPSKVARLNFTSVSAITDVGVQVNMGAAKTPIRAVAALNCAFSPYVAANLSQVSMSLLNSAAGLITTTAAVLFANIVPIAGAPGRFNYFAVLSADVTTAQWVRFHCRAGASGATGYLEVGHLWAGQALVFADGADAGWRLTPIDASDVSRTRGGMPLSTNIPRRQRLTVDLSARSYAALLGTAGSSSTPALRQMLLEAGLGIPVLAIHRSTDAHAMQVSSVYGALTELPDIEHQAGPYHRSSLAVEQIR